MAKTERKNCTFEGREYSHGTELCIEGKCMICNDGRWEQVVTEIFPPEIAEEPEGAERPT